MDELLRVMSCSRWTSCSACVAHKLSLVSLYLSRASNTQKRSTLSIFYSCASAIFLPSLEKNCPLHQLMMNDSCLCSVDPRIPTPFLEYMYLRDSENLSSLLRTASSREQTYPDTLLHVNSTNPLLCHKK